MVFLENPGQLQDAVRTCGYREAHGVGHRRLRKRRAQASRIAEVAEPGVTGPACDVAFSFKHRSQGCAAGAPLRDARRFEKRTSHQVYANSLEPTRIEILQQMLEQNPSATFARYGLAMEYVKSGDLDQAVATFEAVTQSDPNYSAAYFHGGQALEKMGKIDEAREFYRKGIAVTRDPHALSELEAALDILGE